MIFHKTSCVAVFALAILIFGLSTIGDASAAHFMYLADDEVRQNDDEPGTENWVFFWWGIPSGGDDLFWRADASIRSDVSTAINNWTAPIPELTWAETTGTPDVEFLASACPPEAGGGPACGRPISWILDSERDANYWVKSEIRIDPNWSWTNPIDKISAAAHEIGHLYGLHERYFGDVTPPSSCNGQGGSTGDYTIMDTHKPGVTTHCDGLTGPSVDDQIRVDAYWSQGVMADFTADTVFTTGTYTWKDEGWADYRHHPKWFYWDGAQWVEYKSEIWTSRVGVHRLTEEREHLERVNRLDYGAPAGWHMACGDIWFSKYGVPGEWRCSNMILME